MACLEEPMRESTSSQGRQSCSRNFHYSHRRNMESGLQETAKEKCEQTGRVTCDNSSTAAQPAPPAQATPPHPLNSHSPASPNSRPPCTGKIPDVGLCGHPERSAGSPAGNTQVTCFRVVCSVPTEKHRDRHFQVQQTALIVTLKRNKAAQKRTWPERLENCPPSHTLGPKESEGTRARSLLPKETLGSGIPPHPELLSCKSHCTELSLPMRTAEPLSSGADVAFPHGLESLPM